MTKLRVDMAGLTLGELAEAGQLLGAPMHEVMGGVRQPEGIAAMVCMLQRRTNPDYTLADALKLRMADLELVGPDESGKAPAASNGDGPALSPVSGV